MPLHDWTRVDAGLFHDFHQTWAVKLSAAFNQGALPSDYYALLENDEIAPPKARLVRRSEADLYAEKASRVTVRHRHGDVVAVIEIVSPGNKGSRAEFKAFIDKAASLLRQRVHLLLIDLFPPSKRDPQGIHKALWDEFQEEDFELPAVKPFTLAAYDAGPPQVAYVELVGVGDALPEMPIFLRPEVYVAAPLEATYQAAWSGFPAPLKKLLA